MSKDIRIRPDGFVVREGWWHRKSVKWSAVMAIHARRIDRVTYDEIFLIFELSDGKSISVGELDKGFAMFREALADAFADMEANWHSLAEAYAGTPVQVWQA